MERIIGFDFGNITVPVAAGFHKIERVFTTPKYLWISDVRQSWRQETTAEIERDFVWDDKGEFRIGLPSGQYAVKMVFFDIREDHGPFSISAASVSPRNPYHAGQYQVLESDFSVEKGRRLEKEYVIEHSGGALALNFEAENGANFLVNSLEIYADRDTALQVMFDDAPADHLPSPAQLRSRKALQPDDILPNLADWLLDSRKSDGFLGDYEGEQRIWYTTSYPIRTLLAAYEIHGNAKYLDAATGILDRLVREQMPEGSFTQSYRNMPTENLGGEELETVRKTNWMNLADIGSIVAALAAACRYVDDARKRVYTASLYRYFDDWALPFQQENGGFTNAWLRDHYAEWLYSVATGTTAVALGIFKAVTGETKYDRVLDRALGFLIRDWHEDGRPFIWPHDYCSPGHSFHQNVTDFGELFYIYEGVMVAAQQSGDQDLRKRAFEAIRRNITGDAGLIASMGSGVWWPLSDSWTNSKSAAMPSVLLYYLQTAKEYNVPDEEWETVKRHYERCRDFICIPEYARILGIMTPDPDLPWGEHSIQSWTGCAVAATGFAGITFAEMIRPGITYFYGDGDNV